MKKVIGPLNSLMYSRKALIATSDAIFSLAAIILTAHLAPEYVEEAIAIIGILQPLVIVWISAIAKEDAARFLGGASS